MNLILRRVVLAFLAASAGYVGFWAALAPHNWYVEFPGAGMHWLSVLGPYNEHLTRDVGSLYLALLVLSATALARVDDGRLVRTCGGAWTIFSAPHLGFHLLHLSMYGTRDAVLNVLALGATLLCGLFLLVRDPRRGTHPA